VADNAAPAIAGRRLLVVEDDYWIASDLAAWLESEGADVLGPAGSVDDALGLLRTASLPDAGVLDINLGEERVFPVAEALQAARVPFVFLSGYDAKEVPDSYRGALACAKPLDRAKLLRALAELFTAEV
jgi:CheY-like chemotaxis protein